MNENTKEAFKRLAQAIQLLAQSTIHQIGVDNATDVINAAEELKRALDSDETIL